jgi:hypothetical protein
MDLASINIQVSILPVVSPMFTSSSFEDMANPTLEELPANQAKHESAPLP